MTIFKSNYFIIPSIILFCIGIFFNYLLLIFFLATFFFIQFKTKSIFFYFIISIIFFTLFFFELIFKKELIESDYLTINNISYGINNNYGYHPVKNKIFTEKIFYKKKLLKTNNYTINEFGHRKLENKRNKTKCLIFHGGSIMFGQSLNDDETLPYITSKLLEKTHHSFNFAFNGYGPHQFLSKLENLNLKEIENCRDVIIIYQYIHDHIARVTGKRSWGDKSPRYVKINNDLIQKGFFSDFPFKFIMKLRKNFRESKISNIFFNLEKINKKDMEIHLTILKKIESISKKKFISSKFLYFVWKENLNTNNDLNNFFKSRNTTFIEDLKINEYYKSNKIPGDNHPTKEFNIFLANELKNIIG